MRDYFIIISLLLCFLIVTVPAKDKFDSTLQKHLDAIQNRDLNSLEETIKGDSVITLILPNGKS